MDIEEPVRQRRRRGGNQERPRLQEPPRPRSVYIVESTFILAVAIVLTWGYWSVALLGNRLPSPLTAADKIKKPDRFIGEFAHAHVQNLTKIGPRPAGSFENEVLANNYISSQLHVIAKKASRSHRIEIESQKASGAFSLSFMDGMTNVYREVSNIMIKIGPQNDVPYSILLNCHYDTVTDSPGGSDNSAGCAVLLEILRVISSSHAPLKNNIIFLFNGAEENMLQGSHGFITQHKWAKNITAFINLEACGAGGRELLFQAGPENPWLIEAYASSVPRPLASSLAQEIFQAGLIPGDTDYRIFRDYGKIPGLDFAWAVNGYVYHTKLDNAENVPVGSLQRTGDNILPLTLRLANLNYPKDILAQGNLVFFDVLGGVMFRVAEFAAFIFNMNVVGYSAFIVYKNALRVSSLTESTPEKYYIHLTATCLVLFFSWLITLGFVHLYAVVIKFLDRSMSWYARPLWLFFLYGLPTLWIPIKISNALAEWQKKIHPVTIFLISLRVDANQILWTCALMFVSYFEIRSAIFLSFYLATHCVANRCLHDFHEARETVRRTRFIEVYVAIMFLPFLQLAYMMHGALLIIIPMFGRSGSGHDIESAAALISSFMFLILFNYLIPIFSVLKEHKRVVKIFTLISSAAFLILLVTPLGFPYSAEVNAPAPQRYVIMHVEQQVHSYDGRLVKDKGGLWVVDLDINSPQAVSRMVPIMATAKKVDTCDKLLYCGLPYLIPVKSLIKESHWIDTQKPVISVPTKLMLTGTEELPNFTRRYFFEAIGPDHITVLISPKVGSDLVSWSFLNETPLEGPKWNDRKTFFVYLSYSSDPKPWYFHLDIQTSKTVPLPFLDTEDRPAIDIAITGHFLHGAHQRSIKLNKVLSRFPPWTVTSGWVAIYSSYVF